MRLNEFEQDLEETASVGRGSPVQQELEDSETEASDLFVEVFLLVLKGRLQNPKSRKSPVGVVE